MRIWSSDHWSSRRSAAWRSGARTYIYIYMYVFFSDTQRSFMLFCLYICVYICTVGQVEVARRLQSVATEFIALYKAAITAWGPLGDYFCITKKIHDLFHLAQRANEVNPALTSCMQQEDLMGKIKQLMVKCVQSAKPITAVHKAMTKYRLALHLEHRWTYNAFESWVDAFESWVCRQIDTAAAMQVLILRVGLIKRAEFADLSTNRYSCSNCRSSSCTQIQDEKRLHAAKWSIRFEKILNTYTQKALKINLMCLLKFTKIKIKLK